MPTTPHIPPHQEGAVLGAYRMGEPISAILAKFQISHMALRGLLKRRNEVRRPIGRPTTDNRARRLAVIKALEPRANGLPPQRPPLPATQNQGLDKPARCGTLSRDLFLESDNP